MTLHLHGTPAARTWRGLAMWLDNFLAIPYRGMHLGWRVEARLLAERILHAGPQHLTMHAHSRHAAVALYTAVLLRAKDRHMPITIRATGSPRQWFTRRWMAHYGRYLASCDVDIVNAHGDPVAWMPPWFRHDARTRWVGPRRRVALEAHNVGYIRRHD